MTYRKEVPSVYVSLHEKVVSNSDESRVVLDSITKTVLQVEKWGVGYIFCDSVPYLVFLTLK